MQYTWNDKKSHHMTILDRTRAAQTWTPLPLDTTKLYVTDHPIELHGIVLHGAACSNLLHRQLWFDSSIIIIHHHYCCPTIHNSFPYLRNIYSILSTWFIFNFSMMAWWFKDSLHCLQHSHLHLYPARALQVRQIHPSQQIVPLNYRTDVVLAYWSRNSQQYVDIQESIYIS